MSSHPLRVALALVSLLAGAARAHGQTAAPKAAPVAPPQPAALLTPAATVTPAATLTPAATVAPAAPAPVAAPAAPAESQDSAEAKLAIVLRSYTLLQAENEQLQAAQEKLLAEKSALAAELAVAKDALPLAAQAVGLHDQLRRTQDQLAALSLENNQLRTRLTLGTSSSGSVMPSPTYPGSAPAAAPEAPAARTHVIVAGDTLTKISVRYYGTPNRWSEILAANREGLNDEKSLVVGRTLRIP
ncbi:MAG: LysM peptidoglycan-binding domain-containing protein [Opitutales bacterium]|nr:LysM peptidoglycan-binding domain-containing protein [Opitutales bacterium]